MTEYRPNTYADEDMRDIIAEIEKLEANKASIMATAMGECGGIARKIKDLKKRAKDELSIPLKVLNPILKRRKLEQKIADLTNEIDEDYAEVFEDAAGQFCMFAPVERDDEDKADDEPGDEVDAQPDISEAEQVEGAAVLGTVGKAH